MALDSAVAAGPSPAVPFTVRPMPPAGLLVSDRLLGGASALFALVQRLLDTTAGRLCGAQAYLEVLAQPGTPAADWADILLRYRQLAADIRASLIATHDIGQSLLEAGLEDEFGLANSLALLERIAAQMPSVPPDRSAAQEGMVALSEMVAGLTTAQARFSAGHGRLEARLPLPMDEAAESEPALLEGTDLQKEALRLQALQVRQQLAGHAIGLLAVMPRCLLELDED